MLAAVPVQAAGSDLQHSRTDLDGDTYAFRLDPDEPVTIQAGSTISIDATYAAPREDAAVALAWTDLTTVARESVVYFAVQNGGETHIELLDHTAVGQELHIDDPDGPFRSFGGTWLFTSDVTLSARPWHFAVSAPGAHSIDVTLDLHLSENLTLAGEGVAGSGATWAAEDFDGAAQLVADGRTAAAGVQATATAPTGTRGFAVLFPFTGRGAGRYGIEAPGPRDDARTVLQTASGPPPAAHVLAGPAGTYDHWIDAEAWQQDDLDGRAGVFFAAPMPL